MGKHARPANSPSSEPAGQSRPMGVSPTPRGGYKPGGAVYGQAGMEAVRNSSPFASKKVIIGVVAAVAALVLIYIGVGVFFSGHFYPGTALAGHDLSLKSASEVEAIIDGEVSEYSLSVTGDGVDFEITSAEAGASLDSKALVADLLADNNPALWPAGLVGGHDLTKNLAFSSAGNGLADIVRAHLDEFNETATSSVNATIAYDEESQQFEIVPEVYGTAVDTDAVIELASNAFACMEKSVVLGEDELMKPDVLQDDELVIAARDTANKMIAANITFTVAGTAAATLDAAAIAPWVYLGEDYSVALDDNGIIAWADTTAGSVNTYGTTRTFTTPRGVTSTVSGGVYGWIVDKETLVNNVKEYVQNSTVGTYELPMTQTAGAFNGVGQADWGARWIDVNLSTQHATFYDGDSVIWESDFVSGKPDPEHATPTGVYVLNGKQSPSTLIGTVEASTGEPEYETEVQYWMPFVGNAVGFHDASWQSAFGGSRYAEGYGSHGCINLPTDAAASLYGIIAQGDVVVSHQ